MTPSWRGISRVAPGGISGKSAALEMTASAPLARPGDGRLWAIALGLSLVANIAILGLAGLATVKSEKLRKRQPPPPALAATEVGTTVTIFPELAKASAAAAPALLSAEKPSFARTSPDQAAARPERPTFIGERDTVATSDRTPVPSAPPLPSQSGIEPKNPGDFETTLSDYQDGKLDSGSSSQPPDSLPAPMQAAPAPVETPGADAVKSTPPAPANLLQGSDPVDVPVAHEVKQAAAIKAAAPRPATELPKPASEPGFRGFQRKAAIVGSISRTGRSALDVADSPLGRYQAAISRAVEQEWQRNCVRHRDFITPGFLTVRFFIETSGKVRTVRFVGDMETGEVQKGFTLNSIRNAEIPAMPAAIRKDYEKEPLELIFNFYF